MQVVDDPADILATQRETMVKRMSISILLDLLVAGCIASVLIPRADDT